MAKEEHVHVALPKLYGAPAYARPPIAAAAPVERPFDPDELPIESQQTEAERELARQLAASPWSSAASAELSSPREGSPMLRGRPFQFGSITRRLPRRQGAQR